MAIPYSRTLVAGLPWYSVLIVLGIVLAVFLAAKEEKRLLLPRDTAVDLALVIIPCGVVGARTYYVAMSWEQFAHDPVSALYIWQGGIAIYGAVIGGVLGAWIYARRKKLPLPALLDIAAPGLLLAQAIGRWGNYFNMEAYGPVITDARLQFFPAAVLIPQGDGYAWHAATFFYESVWNLCGFAALWLLRKKQKKAGHVFCWYLLIYGSGRFIIEQLRQDSLYIGSLRASQWLSLLLCAAAVIVLLSARMRGLHLGAAVGCATLWLMRWACLQQPVAYAALLIAAGSVAVWLVKDPQICAALVAVLVLDAGGLMASVCGDMLGTIAHTIICSLTLPGYVMCLCAERK